jgi:hypothetical protein
MDPVLEDTHARASGLCVLGRSGPVAPDEQIADSVTPIDHTTAPRSRELFACLGT